MRSARTTRPPGARCRRLADLARAGLEVPDAFVVTSVAYQTVAANCALGAVIERALAGIGPDDFDELAAAETRIREHLAAAPVPAEITDAIAEAYEDLCVRRREVRLPVAVRSSSSTEDAVAASSAGQYDTYLGLAGTAAVLDGVRRCWGQLVRGAGPGLPDAPRFVPCRLTDGGRGGRARPGPGQRGGLLGEPGDRAARPAGRRGDLRLRRGARPGSGQPRPCRDWTDGPARAQLQGR